MLMYTLEVFYLYFIREPTLVSVSSVNKFDYQFVTSVYTSEHETSDYSTQSFSRKKTLINDLA